MARSVMYLKDVNTLWNKIAMDMRDSQYTEGESDMDNGTFPHEYKEGLIPSIAPRYARFLTDWKQGSFWDIIPWGSSIILAAYEQYLFYGNKQILADNYESAKKYIHYLTSQYEDYNRLYHKSGKEKFICAGQHLTCGEIGLVYKLRALSELGRNDIIFDMILKKEHPSYLRFVEQGETTLLEFWRDDARRE